MDLYNKEKKIERAKIRFRQDCPNCCALIERFEHSLKLSDYSTSRIEKYWTFLKSIHNNLGNCFEKVEKVDIENFVILVDGSDKWSENTKSDFKKIFKFFYRWMTTNNLEGDYPEAVKWIKTKIKKSKITPPEQILTKEEVSLLANNTRNARDKAFVYVLYESGCRIAELLNLKIKDVSFDEYGCYILVMGKTGWRRLRLVEHSKDLLNWLDIHPAKNPESYIWLNLENAKEIVSPSSINKMLKDLAERTGISKPVNPHAFRHARATFLSKHLSEALMKQMFGWANDSKMASVYYHLSGKDVDEALLKLNGIKTDNLTDEKHIEIRICAKCNEGNSILSHFCKKCNTPLDLKFMLEQDEKRKEFDNFMKEFLIYYAEMDKNFKKAFRQFVKEKNYEELFTVIE